MRLRTRLLVALAPLAIVPLAVVLPVAQSNLRRTLSRELESRLDGAADAATTALRARGQEVRQAVDELASSTAAEDVARASGAPPARQASTAGRLMRSRGLSVLSLLDSRGVTLSSGHLPARLGDPDPHLFALAQLPAAEPKVAMVELSDALPRGRPPVSPGGIHPAAPAFAPRRRAPTSTQAPLRLPRGLLTSRRHARACP